MNQEPPEINASSPRMSLLRWWTPRWRLTLVGLAILLGGVAIGASISAILVPRYFLHRFMHPEGIPPMIADQMMHELNLPMEQARKVQSIIEKRLREIWKIQEESRPKIDAQFELMKKEVAAVLTKDQARWWEERVKEAQRFRPPPPRGPHFGPPPPPPGGEFWGPPGPPPQAPANPEEGQGSGKPQRKSANLRATEFRKSQ